MDEVIVKDVKEVIINKDGIKIIQNNGGIVELTREQINNVGIDK